MRIQTLFLCVIFLAGASGLASAETGMPPELKSLHRDIHDPEYVNPPKTGGTGFGQFGDDLEKFGEEVAGRLDRIVSKKGFQFFGDPWTIQGIPLIFPSSDTGFNIGLHLILADILREDPHQLQITAQAMASDRGRYKHFLIADLPHAFHDNYHITGKLAYNRDVNFRYFGTGNETSVNENLVASNSPLYQNEREGPSFSFALLKILSKYFHAGPILGLKWTQINYPVGSLVDLQKPVGNSGGKTNYLGLALVYDATDFAPNPSQGTFHEVYLTWYAPFLGSDYDFTRTTYTFRHYLKIKPSLVLAHRTLIEFMTGDVPFYELSAVGGSDSTIGYGGDRFMRGYDGNRFVDQVKFAMGFELRWEALSFGVAKQKLKLDVVPWVDFGRVWNKMYPLEIGTIHASMGWGTRLCWNDRFILRNDFAITPEGTGFYIELGQSF